MELSTQEVEDLRALEEGLWRAEVRFDIERMEEILAPDFFEYGRSGRVYRREDTLAVPAQLIDAQLPLQEFQVRLLARTVAQVSYVSVVTYDGVVQRGRRSSIWTRVGRNWQLRFHQGTPIPERSNPNLP